MQLDPAVQCTDHALQPGPDVAIEQPALRIEALVRVRHVQHRLRHQARARGIEGLTHGGLRETLAIQTRAGGCGAGHTDRPNSTFARGRASVLPIVLRAAAQGLGVALARSCLAADESRHGTLLRPLKTWSVPLPDAYSIISPAGPPGNEAVALLVAWLKREARLPDR